MSNFESKDKDALYAIFQPSEHEFRVLRTVGKEVNASWGDKKVL